MICTPSRTPINPVNVRRSLNVLIKKVAVPKIRFHDLRHTHATLLLAKGVKVIFERLGYRNIKITLDNYSHLLSTMEEDAVNDFIGNVANSVTTGVVEYENTQIKKRIKH